MTGIIPWGPKIKEQKEIDDIVKSVVKMVKGFNDSDLSDKCIAPPGKGRIVEIIRTERAANVIDDYDSPNEALLVAQGLTRAARNKTESKYGSKIPRYCVYDDKGEYVGGDIILDELDSWN